ncbi:MAG: M48 family metalloprotease [Alphaproteobacteria bacterium]|nr:M48 family metalloprotease [Alphaproteobacteria bacterium]
MAPASMPHLLQALGWTLAHFLWQGTLIAMLAAIAMGQCRQPAARYAAGVAGMALMLAAPVATFLAVNGMSGPLGLTVIFRQASSPLTGLVLQGPLASHLDILPWLTQAWFCGVLFFSLRGGLVVLERRRRRQSVPASAKVVALCGTLQRRLGLRRTIRTLECDWLQAPAVIGWLRPVLLLPVTALTGFTPEQLAAVIAHELAHIRRHDALVNLFQILAETLLFYHPAVWWLNRRIRAAREICCDEIAVSLCGDRIGYARALTLMEDWKRAPDLVLAANHGLLSERIFCVLGRQTATPRLPGVTAGLFLAALALGMALFRMPSPVPEQRSIAPRAPAPMIAALPQAEPVIVSAPVRHVTRASTRRARYRPQPAAQPVPEDTPPSSAPVIEAALPAPLVHDDAAPLRLITVNNPPAMDSDPVICRLPQQLPGSRLSGPRTCLLQSQWAQLRSRNQDIAPDGRQVVATLAFDNGGIPDVRLWPGPKAH